MRNNPFDPHGSNYGGSPPTCTITEPTNGQVVPPYFVVKGTAFDDLGLAFVMVTPSDTFVSLPAKGTVKNWASPFASVPYGTNLIRAYALDFGGNQSATDSVMVYVDAAMPMVSLTNPSADCVTNATNIALFGCASVEYPYTISRIDLQAGTNGWTTPSVSVSDWRWTNALSEGTNRFRLRAISSESRTNVTPYLTVVRDTTPPVISLASPTNYQYCSNYFNLSGSVYDQYAGSPSVFLSLDGGPFSQVDIPDGTNFQTNVFLGVRLGYHTNSYYAVDKVGNVSATDALVVDLIDGHKIYVATNGSDTYSGLSVCRPLGSIQTALEAAPLLSITDVMVGAGVYTPGAGLNPSNAGFVATNYPYRLSGGWSSGFITQSGMSELDGLGALYHVVVLSNITNGSLDGFVIRGGFGVSSNLDNKRGAGIRVINMAQSLLSNLILSNNLSISVGAGLDFINGLSNRLYMDIIGNFSSNSVGGAYFGGFKCGIISGSILSNSGSTGGLYFSGGRSNTIGGVIGYNFARSSGGGISMNDSWAIITAQIISNTASNTGGGIYINFYCNFNTIFGPVIGNTVLSPGSGGGAGIYIDNCNSNNLYGLIGFNNGPESSVVMNNAFGNLVSCILSNNYCPETVLISSGNGTTLSNCLITGVPGSNYIAVASDCDNSLIRMVYNIFVSGEYGALFYDSSLDNYYSNQSEINNPYNTGATPDSTNNVVW